MSLHVPTCAEARAIAAGTHREDWSIARVKYKAELM